MSKRALVNELEELELTRDDLKRERERDKDRHTIKLLKSKCAHLSSELDIAEQRAAFVASLGDPSEPTIRSAKPIRTKATATPILVLTDWHAEETVGRDTTDGLNEYSLDICAARVRTTIARFLLLLSLTRGASKVDHLVLALLGDFITGYIHPELVEVNSLSPTEATLFTQDLLHEVLQTLLREAGIKRIVVPCCFGNHGRTGEKIKISTGAKNSYEWLLYRNLERYYAKESRVEWRITNGYHCWVEIQKRKFRFHHGDAIRYMGGVGGISVPTNQRIMKANANREPAYFDVFGHWHQFNYCEPFSWVSAPCLIGYTPYGIYKSLPYSEPGQLYMVVDRTRGITECKKIFCKEE